MGDQRVRVLVDGHVQGVFFRATMREAAQRLGLSGWVRNRPDGRVEAQFQGPADAIEQAVAFCEVGPEGARVTSVDVQELPVTDAEHGFRVR